jgi:glucose-1-phosphate thymidylyltransferase
LPCSKEIFPIGFGEIGPSSRERPKVAAHYLLEKMRLAGAKRAYMVLSKGKWDIPAYLGDGSIVNMAIAYLMTGLPYGVPFTVDSAFPFLADKLIMFGFPDIILQPDDVYLRLLDQIRTVKADLVLGLFPAVNPKKMDMVVLDTNGAIAGIDIKPVCTHLHWTWTVAVWNFTFTRFMHDFVSRELQRMATAADGDGLEKYREWFVGDVIREAIGSELKIDQVKFPQGRYIDIGSPEDLQTAVRTHAR